MPLKTDVDEVLQAVTAARRRAEEIARRLCLETSTLPCFEAYVLNIIMLQMASDMRRGRRVDVGRYASVVERKLSSRKRTVLLTEICRLYCEELQKEKLRIIADVGCGLGLNLNITKSYVADSEILLGIDKNLHFLKMLKGMVAGAEAILADASALPLKDESIDMIFCTGVVHELPNLNAIDEIKRVLKNGGKALLVDTALRSIPSQVLDITRRLRVRLGKEPEMPYTLKQLFSKIEALGMHMEKSLVFLESFHNWDCSDSCK